jgi:hypothetical protein
MGNFVSSLGRRYSSAPDLWQWAVNKQHILASNKVSLVYSSRQPWASVQLGHLAVWMTFSARSTVDKIAAIIFPSAPLSLGFKHSVANMYFIPKLFIKTRSLFTAQNNGIIWIGSE